MTSEGEKVKKSQVFLFILRLFLYFSVTGLVLVHPGISVSFDRIGAAQWFVIIPLQALVAFFPKLTLRKRFVFAAVTLFPLSVWAGGFGPGAFAPFFAGTVSFTITFLLFYHPRWAKPAALEPFFLAWVCMRLLALSRSGEDIAGESMALTQFILVWTGVVFLLHSIVVYFCLYPKSAGKAGREGAAFLFAALAVLVVTLVVLPPDFVRNSIIENLNPERMPEKIKNDSDRGVPRESGGRKKSRRTVPQDENGKEPGLRGVNEYNWKNRSGRGGKGSSQDNRQYMVMVVASDREPVYMGEAFRGQLDPVEGFLQSPQEPLNNMANQRFFVTWFNNEPEFDEGREEQEVFSLSTLPQKYLPWRPIAVDPTILSENTGPLRYIHQVVSNTHLGDPLKLVDTPARDFSNFEKSALAPYLEITLEKSDMKEFSDYLEHALKDWDNNRDEFIQNDEYLMEIFFNENENININKYMERIIAILVSFKSYQYNLSYSDDFSIEALKEFLFDAKEGDCVEFSNTVALLGRLAGIPSRVVTGYLAAESLQTQAHLRGLASLRARIPVLQKFPFDNLFMVTNLHSHSWTQFYVPNYGWLDFEATTFSIPPVGTMDFSTWDVVIPLINEERIFSQVMKFPWQAVLRASGIMAVCALVLAYILRYGREMVLYAGARRGGRAGARSLYLLLLARLAADGKPIKPASRTAMEYAELFPGAGESPHFKTFASIYSELRWREFADAAERDNRFLLLRQEYRSILKTTRRRGIHRWFIRLISLRGLAYL
ncbi:MAG: transglutaminase-like domain-containing protein [Treponema sp.]|jgi:hypothetical protein|nr:transglutaminase-like domain-containing protein [Treponema sp.]